MAEISAIRGQLARLRQEILTSSVFVAGRPDSAAKVTEEANRLERVASALQIILRDLHSTENLLRLRESQLRKVPHSQRYSAEQSLKQLAENVRTLGSDAKALADLIRDLLDRNGLLNPMQKAKDFIDLAGDLDKIAGHDEQHLLAQVLQASKQPSLGPASLGGSPFTFSGVAGLIAFAYVGIKLLQKRFSSKGTSA
jgi:hypothetical protein